MQGHCQLHSEFETYLRFIRPCVKIYVYRCETEEEGEEREDSLNGDLKGMSQGLLPWLDVNSSVQSYRQSCWDCVALKSLLLLSGFLLT